MIRIDMNPTRKYKGFHLRLGKTLPFGATIVWGGVNFSVFSRHATSCELVLFKKHEKKPFAIIPFFDDFKIGDVFTMIVFDLNYEDIEYGYRMDGPFDPVQGHRFDKTKILMDPYAKMTGGRDVWRDPPDWENNPYQYRAKIILDDFDWKEERPLRIPMEDLIIYEMHVRGFTAHQSSEVKKRGTFSAIRDKIPYLKELGINCIELMPIHEFDEFEQTRNSPANGEFLVNYWGYSNVCFFSPKAGYAATGKYGMQCDELKKLILDLHKNGIEVILDVVFNHTAEGNEKGPYISYRGIDNKTYYILTPEGLYYNFSGTGNTLNCNNPIVRNLIVDCLRYWASEYHIDGFRFDLASILGRDQNGVPLANPPLLESLAYDPILGKCKLIAEAWDAGGLYQVGSFPSWGRWAEWNGKYRDGIRKFIKGDGGMLAHVAQRLQGSPDLYQQRGPNASINFITCHDGFTMMDLVSYNEKHNEANGENNKDGTDENNSWNCGWEGETRDPDIIFLRKKQIKNALSLLLMSQGIPMLLSGDEMGNTQSGNNNAYCQDNLISWLNWENLKKYQDIFHFTKKMIEFRKKYSILRNSNFLDVFTWHSTKAWNVNWIDPECRTLAFMLDGSKAKNGPENAIYVAMNMHWEMHGFELPDPPKKTEWHVFCNTDKKPPADIWGYGTEKWFINQKEFIAGPRSVVILIAKKPYKE
ncbi:MAG: glycogen debranching protein GlgX [Spirochaetales bacterium]|nr:glycogen debranching protein GlgX [Spirochaetales bacterium]